MDPAHGSSSKNRQPIAMCCLRVSYLFVTGKYLFATGHDGHDIFAKQFEEVVHCD